MRCSIAVLFALVGVVAVPAGAQNADVYAKTVEMIDSVGPGAQKSFNVVCPDEWIPLGYSLRPFHDDRVSEIDAATVDHGGNALNLATLTDARLVSGAGYRVTVRNDNAGASETFAGYAWCFAPKVFSSGSATLVRQSTTVPPHAAANITSFCAAGQIAVGSFTDGARQGFIFQGGAPVFGTATAPVYLGNTADGTMAGNQGYEATTYNTTDAPQSFTQVTFCGPFSVAPQVLIGSITANVGSPVRFESGAVPDITRVLNVGFDAFYLFSQRFDYYHSFNPWYADPLIASEAMYAARPGTTLESTMTKRGYSYRFEPWDDSKRSAGGKRAAAASAKDPPKATARIVFAALVLPTTALPPAPSIVTVVEFYNQALDHYFITAIPREIGDLDTGVHAGWARTGQSFKAYDAGSTGHTGRHPVCRAYGNPSAGLDSHFYSASMEECYATLSSFNDAWLLESSEVFEMDLPDPATGACPPGDVPVYRLWNNRTDSNHRYTTSAAIRDQMVARDYIAEGYGPNAVTLCALP